LQLTFNYQLKEFYPTLCWEHIVNFVLKKGSG